MASQGRHFNDSSGDHPFSEDSNLKKRSQRGRGLQDLELKPMAFPPVPRDSGCYTGSPMTAPSSLMSGRHTVQFTFDGADTDSSDSCGTPPTVTGDHHMTHSTPLADHELLDMDMDSDEDEDDVFQESTDSFIDSGLQSMSMNAEDGSHYARTNYHPFRHYKQQTERTHHTHSDEESSTSSGEFSTAESAGFDMEGPVSRPIDIPARSNSASPVRDPTEEDAADDSVFYEEESAAAAAAVEVPLRRLQRRATVGQLHAMEHAQLRRTREQENDSRPFSVVGARGPLPDVVPNAIRRDRAMSESAIDSTYHLNRVGSTLQMISDEFSNTTIQKNLNLLQMKQRNPDQPVQQGNSYPTANRRGSGFFAKLFSTSHD